MPGSIGVQGLIVLGLVVLLIFGPKRLPEIGRSLGRGLRELKQSTTGDKDADLELPSVEDDELLADAPPRRVSEAA